jgi:hypothetical protein
VKFRGNQKQSNQKGKAINTNGLGLVALMIVIVLAGFIAYNYLTSPEPAENRLENTVDQLGRGNFDEAADEFNNTTRGDKIQDDLQDIVSGTPTK